MTDETHPTDTGWQAQVLRLTAFLTSPLDPSVASVMWMRAIGTEPETDDNRPREGIRRQSGPFGDGQLEVVITQKRIDWILSPKPAAEAPPASSFADFEQAMSTFKSEGRNWLEIGSPSIHRLAVGAVLLMPVDNPETAYNKLKQLLPMIQVDPVHSSDLFYQINWRRPSQIDSNLLLNRLTRWSAPLIRSGSIQLAPTIIQSSQMTENQYCGLECDHNTAVGRTEDFTAEQVGLLFQELCDLVVGNAKNGEIRT